MELYICYEEVSSSTVTTHIRTDEYVCEQLPLISKQGILKVGRSIEAITILVVVQLCRWSYTLFDIPRP